MIEGYKPAGPLGVSKSNTDGIPRTRTSKMSPFFLPNASLNQLMKNTAKARTPNPAINNLGSEPKSVSM
jgi:hypothetical protein